MFHFIDITLLTEEAQLSQREPCDALQLKFCQLLYRCTKNHI